MLVSILPVKAGILLFLKFSKMSSTLIVLFLPLSTVLIPNWIKQDKTNSWIHFSWTKNFVDNTLFFMFHDIKKVRAVAKFNVNKNKMHPLIFFIYIFMSRLLCCNYFLYFNNKYIFHYISFNCYIAYLVPMTHNKECKTVVISSIVVQVSGRLFKYLHQFIFFRVFYDYATEL